MSDFVVQYIAGILSWVTFTAGCFGLFLTYVVIAKACKKNHLLPKSIPLEISYDAAMAALARMDDPSCGDPNRLIVATYLRTHAPDDGGAI